MKNRKKKIGILVYLLDGILSLIDFICEGFAALCVGVMKGIALSLLFALRALGSALVLVLRIIAAPFMWVLRKLGGRYRCAAQCLRLDGPEFEAYVALVLEDNGFKRVEITKGSGDQGVDILCERNGKTYAVQCKNYDGAVGNFAVQEAYAGAQFYGCDLAAVICPGTFTRGAKELADSTGVLLWDGARLSHMMRVSGRRPRRRKS